jgi:hypothetical protein
MLSKTWTLDGTVGGSGTGSDAARARALSRRLFLLSRILNLEAIIHPLVEDWSPCFRPNDSLPKDVQMSLDTIDRLHKVS